MKGESLKCCSIYSVCSTTQGVKHLRSDIVCIHIHKGTHTHTHGDLNTRTSHVRTRTRAHAHAATTKLCSWPKTASFSSSFHFGQWGAHSCKRPGFDAAPPPFLTHWADLLANQVWLSPTIYHAPCQKSYRAEYLKKSANPRLSGDPRIVIHNNSCTILCHSISLLFHIGST